MLLLMLLQRLITSMTSSVTLLRTALPVAYPGFGQDNNKPG